MKQFSTSKQLIKNTKNFLNIKHYIFLDKLFGRCGVFYGWGRKNSSLKAIELAKKCSSSFVLLEDGFIRSLDLGVNASPSFSLVEDNLGIYYDAPEVDSRFRIKYGMTAGVIPDSDRESNEIPG